jgi:hypothetical protein
VFYYPEDGAGIKADRRRQNDFGYQMVKRRVHRPLRGAEPDRAETQRRPLLPDVGQAQLQPLSYLAYVAANGPHRARPSARTSIRNRIGVVEPFLRGKWSIFAGAAL